MDNLWLLQMPNEIVEKILSYLTYDEISLCRQVLTSNLITDVRTEEYVVKRLSSVRIDGRLGI